MNHDTDVETLIRMRQQALETGDHTDDVMAWNQAFLMALVFQKEHEFHRFAAALDALVTEVAASRSAFEAERLMRKL